MNFLLLNEIYQFKTRYVVYFIRSLKTIDYKTAAIIFQQKICRIYNKYNTNTLSHEITIKFTMNILHYLLFEEPKTIIILRLIKSKKIQS